MEKESRSPLGLNRSKAKKAAWKAKYLANRAARSLFNAEWKGESRGKGVMAFHEGLKSLSFGLST